MSAFGTGTGSGLASTILNIALKIIIIGVFIFVFMRFLADRLLKLMAGSLELLLLFAIGWAVLLAALGEHSGFSKELGAFLAGFSLSSTHLKEAISTRLQPIRDFLLLFSS